MRVLTLGMCGALLVGLASSRLYDCVYFGLMVCRTPAQSEFCAANATAMNWALGGFVVGLAMIIGAIAWFRRRYPALKR